MSLKPRQVDFESTWENLQQTLEVVITCRRVERNHWNDKFYEIYSLCVAFPDSLADKLYEKTKKFLENHVNDLFKEVSSCRDENLLTCYHANWEKYSKGAEYLNQLYSFLNNHVQKQKHSDADLAYGIIPIDLSETVMMKIGELAMESWKKQMIKALEYCLVPLLLNEIQKDRLGHSVNQTVIHGVIESFVIVDEYKKSPYAFYEEIFEKNFLSEMSVYYQQEAMRFLCECNCSEFMERVIQHIDNENLRSRKYLPEVSYGKVTKECEKRMVAYHLKFLHSECKEMVANERRTDLNNLYRLLNPVEDGLGVLIQEVEGHIRSEGIEATKDLAGEHVPSQFVDSIIQVHTKFTELIQAVFAGDQRFIGALDKACAATINSKVNQKATCKSPEYIARYCDSLLKKSTKGISETEIDDKLSQSITVFKYLDDKDIFQRFYSRMLAKRLISGQSQSMDAEESMINKLKQACGYEFTNKLHKMFTDMNISSDLCNKFSDFVKSENVDLGVNFSILVLQAGAWPLGQSNIPKFAIPQELEKSVRMFEQFYNKHFNGRKLMWMHNLCTVELKFGYLKKSYLVTMGTYLMGILLTLNNENSQSYKDLLQATLLPLAELTKQLQALVDAKILIAESETIEETSCFKLNFEYSSKRTKFKIMPSSQKDMPQEVEQTQSAVEEDRKMFISAAIVRIMKTRKLMKHNLLIQEVINQSRARFTPNISMIKKCIESLIDKQYLERTQNSTDEYGYIA